MSELVLAADPRKTKVAVQHEDGTVKPAEIMDVNDNGTMAVKYRGVSTGDWWGGTFDRDGRSKFGHHPFPRLINAPEETKEVEEVCYLNIYPDRKNIFDTEEKARKFALEDAVHVAVPTKTIYRVPKPSPPEPVVLEGAVRTSHQPVAEKAYTIAYVGIDGHVDIPDGAKCTLTIHPGEKP